jgi:hypothetical protein
VRLGFLVVSPFRIACVFLHVERGRSSKRVWRSPRIIYYTTVHSQRGREATSKGHSGKASLIEESFISTTPRESLPIISCTAAPSPVWERWGTVPVNPYLCASDGDLICICHFHPGAHYSTPPVVATTWHCSHHIHRHIDCVKSSITWEGGVHAGAMTGRRISARAS